MIAERDHPELQLVGDHAYWVSGLTLRGGTEGRIDAISRATGFRDPASTALPVGTGSLGGGNLGPLAFTRQGRTWSAAEPGPAEDRLELTATGIATATIAVRRAGLTCDAKVDITSDGPIAVRLAGCGGRTVEGGA